MQKRRRREKNNPAKGAARPKTRRKRNLPAEEITDQEDDFIGLVLQGKVAGVD